MNAQTREPLSEFVCSDCGTPLFVGADCHECGGFGADTPEQWADGQAVRDSKKVAGKYDDVLKPFFALMEAELHANCGKGDRPGWLTMTPQTALLEVYYHVSKLQKAVKNNNHDAIREYAADVANMSMMLLDVCVGIQPPAAPVPAGVQGDAARDPMIEPAIRLLSIARWAAGKIAVERRRGAGYHHAEVGALLAADEAIKTWLVAHGWWGGVSTAPTSAEIAAIAQSTKGA